MLVLALVDIMEEDHLVGILVEQFTLLVVVVQHLLQHNLDYYLLLVLHKIKY